MADGTLFGDLRRSVIVDLFCGVGGGSEGVRRALGRDPDVAVNHWQYAIDMHRRNHPTTEHFQEDVFNISPWQASRGKRVDLLVGTAPCPHFSNAKGAAPFDEGIRCLSNVFVDWANKIQPRIILLENVKEFAQWGPLDEKGRPIKERRGEYFRQWVQQIEAAGYKVEWRLLSACDYGAPTSRLRFFLIARCDGQPIQWPPATHGDGLIPYRTAGECIDWSLPMCSIFASPQEAKVWARHHGMGIPQRPLEEATMERIAKGLKKFVLGNDPYLLTLDGGAYAAPFLSRQFGASVGQQLTLPMPTATVVNKTALVSAFFTQFYGTAVGSPLSAPVPTITSGGQHIGVIAAFLAKYYGADGQFQGMNCPLDTITTKDRFGLVTVSIQGEQHYISDIYLRMLSPGELAKAQGFPDSYIIEGSKKDRIKGIGNSVVPQVVEALIRANFP